MDNPKFQIFKGSNGYSYYFRLRAANGEIVLGSEAYTTIDACKGGIASVKINSPYDSRYEKIDQYNKYRFNLKSSNGEIIGKSEEYTSSWARDNGIAAVKRDAPTAPTEDLT
jgi:uncharacterized protein YegP (UPF0339 family)